MKIQPECLPCLLRRVLYEVEIGTDDAKLASDALIAAVKTLSEVFSPSRCSAEIATHVHRTVYEKLGNNDPYRKLKEKSNEVALSLLPKVERVIDETEDPLKAAMVCSIIGNILDFGIKGGSGSPEDLFKVFDKYFSEGLGYDDYGKLHSILLNSKKVVLVTDNCGEIVFDKVLCRELKRFNPGTHLTLVVRGAPVLSDATIEDAERLGFDEVVDEVQTTGSFAVGFDIHSIPERLKKTLEEADVIVCKGMANYEVFSETSYKPVAYLLRTKCTAIARSMNLPLNVSAIKVYE